MGRACSTLSLSLPDCRLEGCVHVIHLGISSKYYQDFSQLLPFLLDLAQITTTWTSAQEMFVRETVTGREQRVRLQDRLRGQWAKDVCELRMEQEGQFG